MPGQALLPHRPWDSGSSSEHQGRLPEIEMTLERNQAPHTLLGPSLSELVTRREAPCKQETVNCPGWASRGNGEKHIYHAKELHPENFL